MDVHQCQLFGASGASKSVEFDRSPEIRHSMDKWQTRPMKHSGRSQCSSQTLNACFLLSPCLLLARSRSFWPVGVARPPALAPDSSYSKDPNNRTPPLTFRTYQILLHTNNDFHCLYSYLDLLPQGPLGYPRGAKPPWYPRSYWRKSR